jgi:hypothetical protein
MCHNVKESHKRKIEQEKQTNEYTVHVVKAQK